MRLRTKYTQRLPTACGLVLDVPLFEGSGEIAHDLSGKGNEGVITDATWSRNETGVCLDLNGSTSYIDCGNDITIQPDLLTIDFWAKIKDDSSYRVFFATEIPTVTKYGIKMMLHTNDNIYFDVADGVGSHRCINTFPGEYFNKWIHFVITYNGSIMKTYINTKVLAVTTNWSGVINWNAVLPLLIARIGDNYCEGLMDKVHIYNRALSTEEIKHIYEQPDHYYCRGS